MPRRLLACLLVSLIALQSVFAMADIHQSHQPDHQHQSFDHTHDAASASTDSAQQGFDCHHCCHCHGMTYQFIPHRLGSAGGDISAPILSRYLLNYHSRFNPPSHRPPIV